MDGPGACQRTGTGFPLIFSGTTFTLYHFVIGRSDFAPAFGLRGFPRFRMSSIELRLPGLTF